MEQQADSDNVEQWLNDAREGVESAKHNHQSLRNYHFQVEQGLSESPAFVREGYLRVMDRQNITLEAMLNLLIKIEDDFEERLRRLEARESK